jgi:hypothetical protein
MKADGPRGSPCEIRQRQWETLARGIISQGEAHETWRWQKSNWGERTRLACRFGRRARIIVGQISWLKGFRRDAENGNRDGRAPHFRMPHLNGSFPVFILGWKAGGLTRNFEERQLAHSEKTGRWFQIC